MMWEELGDEGVKYCITSEDWVLLRHGEEEVHLRPSEIGELIFIYQAWQQDKEMGQ